ncbi:MAG: Na+/H+ antiporter subunit B [Pseudomonadota bacterium]
MKSLILRTATRPLAALMLLFSIYMLWRGHNEPGGGFIGGLIAAIGYALYAISHGAAAARRVLRVDPRVIAMVGLALAIIAGLVPAFSGEPLFTGKWLFLGDYEGGSGLPLSTVLLFDIGVYLVVLGSVLALVLALEEEA